MTERLGFERDGERKAPRQAAAYGVRAVRRDMRISRPADGIYGRLQAVDRVMEEMVAERDADGAGIGRRANRLGRERRR